MLKRGDVVVYKHKNNPEADMNGSLAIVISIKDRLSVNVQPISWSERAKSNMTTAESYFEAPWFNLENCEVIGHIDLDALNE